MDLDFLCFNQKKLHADQYNSAHNAFCNENVAPEDVGQQVILLSTFTGSDHFMQQLYQDSMTIVHHFGKPALFITFTANPNWIEITRELLKDENSIPMQTWQDQSDLVACVFQLKLKAFIEEMRQGNIFGDHTASIYTVKYQK